jgi:pSer/pThr/pTyr-binding forkhead associated (FHA) protein
VAVVTQDRAYFEQMQAKGVHMGSAVEFPALTPERRFPLGRKQLRIGRSSADRDLKPEIDLSGLPADPGISRLHALLVPAPNGTWAVLDPGSANGTLLNGREIPAGELVTLHEGDRINIGAWTAITIYRE